jgi:metal-responsive CopG/Arc/MetJ family transcriptional regulator
MKTIQITIDDKLLAALDADEEVKKIGRSALFRRIAAEFLESRRRTVISNRYHKAYGDGSGLGQEFAGWERENTWPAE